MRAAGRHSDSGGRASVGFPRAGRRSVGTQPEVYFNLGKLERKLAPEGDRLWKRPQPPPKESAERPAEMKICSVAGWRAVRRSVAGCDARHSTARLRQATGRAEPAASRGTDPRHLDPLAAQTSKQIGRVSPRRSRVGGSSQHGALRTAATFSLDSLRKARRVWRGGRTSGCETDWRGRQAPGSPSGWSSYR